MHCKNCGHYVEEWQNFCGNCGAKIIRNRLSPKILAEQVNREILAIDNRLFRTFYALFRAPQDVIVGYINGVRRKYQDVLQYFAIALTIAGFQVFLMKIFFPEAFQAGPETFGSFASEEAMKENPFINVMGDADNLSNFQAVVYILSLPLSALSSFCAYFIVGDRQYNLTEHFVINLYYSAQVIIFTAIINILLLTFGVDYFSIALLLTLPNYAFYFYALWRVFDDRLVVSLGKYLIVMTFQGIIFIILMILAGIVGFTYAYIKQGGV